MSSPKSDKRHKLSLHNYAWDKIGEDGRVYVWKKISPEDVRQVWKKAEDDDCGQGSEITIVPPEYHYELNGVKIPYGTPVCYCGKNLVYSHTEILDPW